MSNEITVWVFKGPATYPGFPSAVFSNLELAEKWIEVNKLTGVLTEYPVDISILDWAIQNDLFEPDFPEDVESDKATFIANFSSGHQRHYHYEEGKRL